MEEKELRENAERYCELLIVYDGMLEALDAITKKITQTRKEILFLEELLQENGVKIKDVEIKEEKPE
jgi:hypothetical protein